MNVVSYSLDNILCENQCASNSMKGILYSSGFPKHGGYYMKEHKATLQTSHKTPEWTDLLIGPEEMSLS